jgi:hypothetical protein
MTRLAGLLALLATTGACGRRAGVSAEPEAGAAAASTGADPKLASIDLLAASPRCRIDHRGAFVDLGTVEAAWATPGNPDAAALPPFERDGATWGRVLDRAQTFTVALDDTGPAIVSVRGRARAAKKAVASIDGRLIGTLAFAPNEDRVATAANAAVTLGPGLHTVTLRWSGPAKKDEPLAELDWLRVGAGATDAKTEPTYAAPTRRDAVTQVAIGGTPRRAYTLMAPAVVRCALVAPAGGMIRADVGAVSEGTSGEVEVRVRRGEEPPRVVATQPATPRAWSKLEAPLGVPEGTVVVVELAVTKGPRQGRVAIAEPQIGYPSEARDLPAPAMPTGAIVVVLAGAGPAQLAAPGLQKLAREGVVFRGHRAPSQHAAASVASLLTGLPVPVHALEDPAARLSPRTALLGRRLRPFGIESAMFSEAPTTGPAFGFAQDWTNYAARSPLDGPSVAFEELSRYVAGNEGKRFLLVVHARGAHPPWEVAPEALKSLPPEGYTGPIDPKHAVTLLAKARRGLLRLADADRARLRALLDAAFAAQDAKLDAALETLRAKGALDKILVVVTSDTPVSLPPSAVDPAVPAEADADPLAIPLIVRFPTAFAAGTESHAVTEPTDVAATVLAAFGGALDGLAGRDLSKLAQIDGGRDAHLSDDGRGYQLSWGDLRLVGTWGRAPSLRGRAGQEDLRTRRPFEYLAAWGLAAEARASWLSARAHGPGREPATIDPATQAALDSWERTR